MASNIQFSSDLFRAEILKLSTDIVWKNLAEANRYEAPNRSIDRETFMAAHKGLIDFNLINHFDYESLRAAGLSEDEAVQGSESKFAIPEAKRDLCTRVYLERLLAIDPVTGRYANYVEYNQYYRMLNGLPPIDEDPVNFIYNRKYPKYAMDIPVHDLPLSDRYELEALGYFDELLAANPTKRYLKYMGRKLIDIYEARSAERFDILWMQSSDQGNIQNDFKETYSQNRYMANTVFYSSVYSKNNQLYDNFMAMSILFMTIQMMNYKYMDADITRDFYDTESLMYVYDSYGVPFFSSIPLQYHQKIVKKINRLISYKGSTQVFFDLFDLFDLGSMNIYSYYLVKSRRFNADGTPSMIRKKDDLVWKKSPIDSMSIPMYPIWNDRMNGYLLYDPVGPKIHFTPDGSTITETYASSSTVSGVRTLINKPDDETKFVGCGTDGKMIEGTIDTLTDTRNIGKCGAKIVSINKGYYTRFVTASDGFLGYSEDGMHWIKNDLEPTVYITDICYGNGIIVAIGYEGVVYTSTDEGVSWVKTIVNAAVNWYSIVYANNEFTIVSFRSGQIYKSADGISWTRISSNILSIAKNIGIVEIDYINGVYMIAGTYSPPPGDSAVMVYSTDRITWTFGTDIGISTFYDFAYGNETYVLLDSAGYTYTSKSLTGPWTSSAYLRKRSMSSLVFIDGLFYLSYNDFRGGSWLYSEDGLNWESIDSPMKEFLQGAFITPREYISMAADIYGVMNKQLINLMKVTLHDVIYSDRINKYIMVGEGSTILVADNTDPLAWKRVTLSNQLLRYHTFTRVRQIGNYVVVFGDGVILYSSDGTTWTLVPDSDKLVNQINAVIIQDTRIIAVANGGSIYTANTTSFTTTGFATINTGYPTTNFMGIIYANDTYIICADNGEMLGSKNGTDWSRAPYIKNTYGDVPLYTIDYHNETYVMGSTSGTLYISHGGELDPMQNYNVGFAKVKLNNDPALEISDSANYVPYSELIASDPFWVPDKELNDKLFQEKYNYTETKYIGVQTVFDVIKIATEYAMFFKLIQDNKKYTDVMVIEWDVLPNRVSLYDLFAYLASLVCQKYGYEGNISNTLPTVGTVLGFNFKENIMTLLQNISENDYLKNDATLINLLKNIGVVNLATVTSSLTNILALKTLLTNKMGEAKSLNEYFAYRDLYTTIMVSELMEDGFSVEGGALAPTFKDLLKYTSVDLYNRFLQKADDTDEIDSDIQAVIDLMEKNVPDLRYLSNAIDLNVSSMINNLFKILNFFKSGKSELVGYNIVYNLSSRGDNFFKLLDKLQLEEITGIEVNEGIHLIDLVDVMTRTEATRRDLITILDRMDDPYMKYRIKDYINRLEDDVHEYIEFAKSRNDEIFYSDFMTQSSISLLLKTVLSMKDSAVLAHEEIAYQDIVTMIKDHLMLFHDVLITDMDPEFDYSRLESIFNLSEKVILITEIIVDVLKTNDTDLLNDQLYDELFSIYPSKESLQFLMTMISESFIHDIDTRHLTIFDKVILEILLLAFYSYLPLTDSIADLYSIEINDEIYLSYDRLIVDTLEKADLDTILNLIDNVRYSTYEDLYDASEKNGYQLLDFEFAKTIFPSKTGSALSMDDKLFDINGTVI